MTAQILVIGITKIAPLIALPVERAKARVKEKEKARERSAKTRRAGWIRGATNAPITKTGAVRAPRII